MPITAPMADSSGIAVAMPGGSLRERFERFVATLDGFESVDALLAGKPPVNAQRADYLLNARSVIIEQKTLVFDPADRPQKYIERLVRERKLIFWGQLSTDVLFGKMKDGERYKRAMFDDLTKGLIAAIAKADDQTRDTRQLFNIPDAAGVVVVLNEGADTLAPDIIRYGLQRAYEKRNADGEFRYTSNAGVIVISELHQVPSPSGQRLLPLTRFLRGSSPHAEAFSRFADEFLIRWSKFNHVPLLYGSSEDLLAAR